MTGTQETIVVVGKGGIGKSLVASNLSVIRAVQGSRVLHVGCDPKHDSSRLLVPGHRAPTVASLLLAERQPTLEEVTSIGIHGIHCIEAGGPPPGRGCAGRAIVGTLDLLEGNQAFSRYSVVVFDILGDVVCGGFAAPLRKGFGRKVVILTSGEWMSLWAANNIARMVTEYTDNGVYLAGLVMNSRVSDPHERSRVARFARKIRTSVLECLPWDPAADDAEVAGEPVVLHAKDAPLSRGIFGLADKLLAIDPAARPLPRPMEDSRFEEFLNECR